MSFAAPRWPPHQRPPPGSDPDCSFYAPSHARASARRCPRQVYERCVHSHLVSTSLDTLEDNLPPCINQSMVIYPSVSTSQW